MYKIMNQTQFLDKINKTSRAYNIGAADFYLATRGKR